MGFLKKFFKNVLHESAQSRTNNSFEHATEDQLEEHLSVARYGNFTLTDAVRPSLDLKVVPQTGYRHDSYRDEESGRNVPVLMASASSEVLFDLFIELLDPLGAEVDVVLETSHQREGLGHNDLYREHIDMPVLKSTLYDFEEMLTHDGCSGVAVLNPNAPLEVQFDEHKLLIVYGSDLKPFEKVLHDNDIFPVNDIKFITEAEHVHASNDAYIREFEQLTMRLGMDSMY